MIVVKLGGSLYNTPELTLWLQALTHYSSHTPIVITPGGGPFADQVRVAQQQHDLSDKIAHHMAIVAMKQFGLLLANIAPNAQLLNTNEKITSPLSIWLPDDNLLAEPCLPHTWEVTSDSIALWLAVKLDVEQLILIKSIETNTASIAQLTLDQVIDSAFSRLFSQQPIDTRIMHHQAYAKLDSLTQKPSLFL